MLLGQKKKIYPCGIQRHWKRPVAIGVTGRKRECNMKSQEWYITIQKMQDAARATAGVGAATNDPA
ncbi:hypothetical protein [Bradyrhizobium stylosanthis]|uniref:hypothetical protein n=1 Tax=Bradyrhizobium stylosanthis TaxID=1803665 RepID=UPI001648FDBF|nr:hypothetical protein [Bradyrhizobium stylosanthis]